MATANRKELHVHFIRGRDRVAPIGDGVPNLRQQVKAGQKRLWGGRERRERRRRRRRSHCGTARGRESRERNGLFLPSSLLFSQNPA